MTYPAVESPTELQLNDARFDRPSRPLKNRLFICSTERTGSWLLCRAMLHYGAGVPHEYFNPLHFEKLGPRLGIHELNSPSELARSSATRRRYLDALLTRRCANGIFATKIHWNQYAAFLDNPEGNELLRNGSFVHLFREDLLDQAISLHIANSTGRWWTDGSITTAPVAEPQFFDTAMIAAALEALADADLQWRLFFASNDIKPLRMSYERLSRDVNAELAALLNWLDLELAPQVAEFRAEPPGEDRDRNVPPRAEIRARFLADYGRLQRPR
jgi:LPS sulfotransferase NodH